MSRHLVVVGLATVALASACGAVAAPSASPRTGSAAAPSDAASTGSAAAPSDAASTGSAAASSAEPSTDFAALPDAVNATPILWLSADKGVTQEGGLVTEWKGVGGTGLPAGANERPMLAADGIAGRPALQFDGKDDQLEVAEVNINPSVHPDLTVIAVFTSDVDEVEEDVFHKLYGHDDEGYDRVAGLDTRGMRNYTVYGGETGEVVGYFDLEADTTYLTVDAWHPQTVQGWVNGKSMLGTGWPVDNGEGLPTFFVGGTGTVFLEPWQGKIAEMLVFDGALAEPARIAIEEFLALKYDIELER